MMNIERFWDLVAMVNWQATATMPDKEVMPFTEEAQNKLLRTLTPEEANAMSDRLNECHNALSNKVGDYLGSYDIEIGLGDDSFSDLINHIIGCGKEEYEATLANPKHAVERAKKNDYCESFAYVVPYASTYDDLKVDSYVERAQKSVNELDEALADARFAFAHAEMEALRDHLLHLAHGDWMAFMGAETEGRAAAEKLAETYLNTIRALVGPYAMIGNGGVLTNKWAVWNLYSDIKRYAEFF